MSMRGIDCASYQAGIDPRNVPCDFVIVKSTQGTTYTNPDFHRLAEATLGAGKALGVYHYASGGDASAEARHMLDVAGRYIGDAIFCLDWEGIQNSAFGSGRDSSWIDEFCSVIENRVGSECLVYLSKSVIGYAAGHKLWVAQYADMNRTGYQDHPWNEGAYQCTIRQYTSMGWLDGWGGDLDLNKAYMTREEWDAWAAGNGAPKVESSSSGISVDGWWGKETTRALQSAMGTVVDGIVSGQLVSCKTALIRDGGGWQWNDGKGSMVIRALQSRLGVKADGWFGHGTCRALQRYLGVTADGVAGNDTVTALQRRLNSGF